MFTPTPTPSELRKQPKAIALLKDGLPVSEIASQLRIRRTIVFHWRANVEMHTSHKSRERGRCPQCRCMVYLPCMACEIKAAIAEGYSGLPQFADDKGDVSLALDFRGLAKNGKKRQEMARRRAAIFRQPQPTSSRTTARRKPSKAIRPKASDPDAAESSEERARLIRQREERLASECKNLRFLGA